MSGRCFVGSEIGLIQSLRLILAAYKNNICILHSISLLPQGDGKTGVVSLPRYTSLLSQTLRVRAREVGEISNTTNEKNELIINFTIFQGKPINFYSLFRLRFGAVARILISATRKIRILYTSTDVTKCPAGFGSDL